MPNRILREGILRSTRIATLSWPAEVFYRRLHSVVDDFGRYHAHPMLLRAACYPLQLDKVSDSDIGKWTRETAEAGLVRVYEVAGEQYIEVLDFRQQLRAKHSKFPAFDDPLSSECIAGAAHPHTYADSYSESNAEGKPRARARATLLPPDFSVSERVAAWAAERGYSNLPAYLEFFIGRNKANGKKYLDWDQAFMNCIREDWPGLRKVFGVPQQSPQPMKCSACGATNISGLTQTSRGRLCDACYRNPAA